MKCTSINNINQYLSHFLCKNELYHYWNSMNIHCKIDLWFLCFGKDNWMIIVGVLDRTSTELAYAFGCHGITFFERSIHVFHRGFSDENKVKSAVDWKCINALGCSSFSLDYVSIWKLYPYKVLAIINFIICSKYVFNVLYS